MAHIEKNYPGREIQVEIPDDFRMVPMDAKLIEQVITNLLDNAVKHTTCEEAITVCVSYLPDKAQVTVRDEGEGIAKEDDIQIQNFMVYTLENAGYGRHGCFTQSQGMVLCANHHRISKGPG